MAQKRTTPDVNRQINENLKRVYDEALNEELPSKFLDLIAQLNEKERVADEK